MKLGDLSKVRMLGDGLRLRSRQLDLLNEDKYNLAITIASEYLPQGIKDVLYPNVVKAMQDEVRKIENELRALGVDPDA